MMDEVALHCGQNPEIIGIYTQANKSASSKNLPVLILVNSGLLPNSGPFRLYVQIARYVAKLGFDSFRFDLSGIGESERNPNELSRSEQQINDLCDVMNSLEKRYQKNQFIVAGICTGADNAHRAMVADSRVVGCIGVDGYFYKTKRYYLNYFLNNIALGVFKRNLWKQKYSQVKQITKNALEKVTDRDSVSPLESVTVPYRWEVPPKPQTASEYQTFIDNDQRALCIFTASWPYNYAQQHADAFPDIDFGDHIQVQYLENAPHIFAFSDDRDELIEVISVWLKMRFM